MPKFVTVPLYVPHADKFVMTRVALDDISYYREAVPPSPESGFTNTIPEGANTVVLIKSETCGLFSNFTTRALDLMIEEATRNDA